MLPFYDVHKQGLIDKSEKPIDGESTFKYSINIRLTNIILIRKFRR